jgi:hypothetical protein
MQHSPFLGFALASLAGILAGCGEDSSTTPTPSSTAVGNHGITVVAPNGGESLRAGTSATLKWTYNPDSLTSARLLLSCNGVDWADLTVGGSMSLEGRAGGTADTTLVVPDSVYSRERTGNIPLVGSACSFKVQDYNMRYNFDTSDTRFAIQAR